MVWAAKKKDSKPPKVEITSPKKGSSFQIPTELIIKGSAQDETKLEKVTAAILDENFNPITLIKPITVIDNRAEVNILFDLDDIQLNSGKYYAKIGASDGTNIGSDFAQISLIEVPRTLDALYTVTTPTSTETRLYKIDQNKPELIRTLNSDYFGACANSRMQSIRIAGMKTGGLFSLSAKELITQWETPISIFTTEPYCTDIYEGPNGLTYVSATKGNLYGYGQFGSPSVSFSPIKNYQFAKSCITDKYVISSQQSNAISESRIVVNFKNSISSRE